MTSRPATRPFLRGRLAVLFVGAALIVGLMPAPASAAGAIVFDGSPGTGAPPPTLGGYPMTPFGPDGYPVGAVVSSVPAPGGGVLAFNQPQLVKVPAIIDGWSPTYPGHTYNIPGYSTAPLVLTLPADTKAFYLYGDMYRCGTWTMTATAQDGTTSGPVTVTPNCSVITARYFGFYSTGASPLATITLTTNEPTGAGYVIGQFGIYRASPAGSPMVNGFSPGSGRVGSTVTIVGVNLSYASRVTFFNGVPAAFSVRSPTTIVATVPAGAATGPIRVTTPFGSSQSARNFYVLP